MHRDGGKFIHVLDVHPATAMGIDLTGPDEQDWMDGEEAPPIRYSELTTDEERTKAVLLQLKEPLAEALSDLFFDQEYVYHGSRTKFILEHLAESLLLWLEDTDETPSAIDLLQSVEKPTTGDSGGVDEYLSAVAELVVNEVPDEKIESVRSSVEKTCTDSSEGSLTIEPKAAYRPQDQNEPSQTRRSE
jgi:hypothetical protein